VTKVLGNALSVIKQSSIVKEAEEDGGEAEEIDQDTKKKNNEKVK